jgi:Amt family ammonium transporter
VSGILVVLSVISMDRLRLDDPVGAISVHLVCGVWGTLAVGMFAPGKEFLTQLMGVGAVGVASFAAAFMLLYALKATMGLRVTESEERRGLDIDEHGQEAYGGFQIFSNQ